MRPGGFLVLAGALVAVPMAVRVADFASRPPFEEGLPARSPMDVRLEGFRTVLSCGPGRLALSAERVLGGHEDVGRFKLGPSTFGDVRDAVAVYRAPDGASWTVRARRGRWTEDEIRFEEHPIVEDPSGRAVVRSVAVVHLKTGELTVE